MGEINQEMSAQEKLQEAMSAYQALQTENSTVVESRQKLAAQLSENTSVKKEFALLTPNNTIFKLVGGCLVKQDPTEAKSNVDKRIEFINSELKKVDAKLKSLEEKTEAKKMECVKLQGEIQEQQQSSGQRQ